VRTGKLCDGPESRDIRCYRVLVVGEEVWVGKAK